MLQVAGNKLLGTCKFFYYNVLFILWLYWPSVSNTQLLPLRQLLMFLIKTGFLYYTANQALVFHRWWKAKVLAIEYSTILGNFSSDIKQRWNTWLHYFYVWTVQIFILWLNYDQQFPISSKVSGHPRQFHHSKCIFWNHS